MNSKRITSIFLFIASALPIYSFADTLSGNYMCRGFDPILQQEYKGRATISEMNNIYTMVWKFNDGTQFHGTGIKQKDVLSVIYKQDQSAKYESTRYGVQQYFIQENKLVGQWVFLDGTKIGRETCNKQP